MNDPTKISKYLSYILRHAPGSIGLTLMDDGWLRIEDLISASEEHGNFISIKSIQDVVKNSDKQRFLISGDGLFIKANQGHSVSIELNFKEVKPPDQLYHGTAKQFLKSIQEQGLLKMKRHHVHLSDSEEKARQVGMRRGSPIVLAIKSSFMFEAGEKFYLSENGVWLTDHVSPAYIRWG
ncbi:RNA 2'-phosphotransferase [Leptospira sarikeiensis]|uniref:Probable RNA 2'-phosphotransferase n=1 Tax=Leptospira sarikeiensis TaxID=2484943 RepID=A0A4V6QM49_9LEPT|nr:RNA 2'-phosphotransferase [Leptospira sarikeiensis]TGL58725.1 RNA 2'-phosphotransferase [Leptospira sarikeiensis]